MTIPLGPTLPPGSSGLPVPPAPGGHESGPLSSVPLLESCGDGAGPIWPCSGWGLPSRHVTMPLVRSYRTISPLPTGPFGSAFAKPCGRWSDVGGVFSVALSVRSPSLGVTQHPALRSPDFPPVPAPCGIGTGGHPTDFGHYHRTAGGEDLQPKNREGRSTAFTPSLRAPKGCTAISDELGLLRGVHTERSECARNTS